MLYEVHDIDFSFENWSAKGLDTHKIYSNCYCDCDTFETIRIEISAVMWLWFWSQDNRKTLISTHKV